MGDKQSKATNVSWFQVIMVERVMRCVHTDWEMCCDLPCLLESFVSLSVLISLILECPYLDCGARQWSKWLASMLCFHHTPLECVGYSILHQSPRVMNDFIIVITRMVVTLHNLCTTWGVVYVASARRPIGQWADGGGGDGGDGASGQPGALCTPPDTGPGACYTSSTQDTAARHTRPSWRIWSSVDWVRPCHFECPNSSGSVPNWRTSPLGAFHCNRTRTACPHRGICSGTARDIWSRADICRNSFDSWSRCWWRTRAWLVDGARCADGCWWPCTRTGCDSWMSTSLWSPHCLRLCCSVCPSVWRGSTSRPVASC